MRPYRAVATLTAVWTLFYTASRVGLFRKELAVARGELEEDRMFVALVCQHGEVVRHIGRHARSCADAESRIAVHPVWHAVQKVSEATFLCGPASCASVLNELPVAHLCVLAGVAAAAGIVWVRIRGRMPAECLLPVQRHAETRPVPRAALSQDVWWALHDKKRA